MATRKAAVKSRATVRMYRQGLGDCFLITIPRKTGKPFRMMIDCGVVLGTADPGPKMARVVDDALAATGGELDVLVVTHEHWDHVSGFVQAQTQFQKFKVKEIWLAWTEDPADALATKLRSERRTAEQALRMASHHLAALGASEAGQRVDSLVSFFGAAPGSTGEALENARKLAAGEPRYCRPGEPPIEVAGLPGVKFWVMGPPRDEKLLKKADPSKGTAYGLDAGPGGSQAFTAAAWAEGAGDSPFDGPYAIPMARAEHVPFFANRYFGGGAGQDWRRIDGAWLESSETMALQLDSATNNTSLVLAIELPGTKEVLLFPGDAQAGNWLSWQSLHWVSEGISGPDLLARTVFYKVGHHGSHNATLRAQGLEQMTSDELMAMIPVDHDMAVKKRWGQMPLPDLVDRLKEKTHGRLLRVDDAVKSAADLDKLKPAEAKPAEWRAFTDRVTVNELYYELRF